MKKIKSKEFESSIGTAGQSYGNGKSLKSGDKMKSQSSSQVKLKQAVQTNKTTVKAPTTTNASKIQYKYATSGEPTTRNVADQSFEANDLKQLEALERQLAEQRKSTQKREDYLIKVRRKQIQD